jgi:hypothetical protein
MHIPMQFHGKNIIAYLFDKPFRHSLGDDGRVYRTGFDITKRIKL